VSLSFIDEGQVLPDVLQRGSPEGEIDPGAG
jgi:hypothetical protein